MTRRIRAAVAGAAAATVWGLAEPLDQRLFRYDYSDIALLGKFATRRRWRGAGFAIHAANGAVFGLAYDEVRRRRPSTSAVELALLEHVALFPLSALVDRHHPARGTRGLPKILHPRAFGQATVRHALFGVVLGRLAGR